MVVALEEASAIDLDFGTSSVGTLPVVEEVSA